MPSRAADRAVRELDDLRRRLERDIARRMLSLDTQRGSDMLVSDRAALTTAAKVLQQVDAELQRQGVQVVRAIAERQALAAVESVVDDALPVDARLEIQAIVRGQIDEVAQAFRAASSEMRAAVNAGVAGGTHLGDLIGAVAQKLGVTMSQASSAVDAAVMAAGRHAVVAAVGDDDSIVFVYVGPQDRKTRDFCRPLVGKAFTREQIDKMRNGTTLAVVDFAGGYGCRHSWAPIDREQAVEEGLL